MRPSGETAKDSNEVFSGGRIDRRKAAVASGASKVPGVGKAKAPKAKKVKAPAGIAVESTTAEEN